MSKPITAELVGGLGNQLFIYAAALEQAERLGVDVLVDISWFHKQDKRSFQLNHIIEDLRVVGDLSAISRFVREVSSLWKRFSKQPLYIEVNSSFDSEIFAINEGTRLRGYFQSTRYFPKVGRRMTEAILAARVGEGEQEQISDISSHPFNAIHVRRGDYFYEQSTRDFHGITSREYFQSGTKLFRNRDIPCLVFSDSPELARMELDGVPNLEFDSRIYELGDVANLKLMSQARDLVTSNSSFSWWAAFTLSHQDSQAKIITPKPWSKDIDFNYELINPNWVTVAI